MSLEKYFVILETLPVQGVKSVPAIPEVNKQTGTPKLLRTNDAPVVPAVPEVKNKLLHKSSLESLSYPKALDLYSPDCVPMTWQETQIKQDKAIVCRECPEWSADRINQQVVLAYVGVGWLAWPILGCTARGVRNEYTD